MNVVETSSYTQCILFISETSNSLDKKSIIELL